MQSFLNFSIMGSTLFSEVGGQALRFSLLTSLAPRLVNMSAEPESSSTIFSVQVIFWTIRHTHDSTFAYFDFFQNRFGLCVC